mgnify:CR=1 FL=1
MEVLAYLREVSQLLGPSGHELETSAWLAEKFRPLCDEVRVDALHNVIALKKGVRHRGKPIRVMLSAHQDEIALMVSDILPDGTLRMGSVGGVDPRILPASQVIVHGTERLIGVIGAKPPHLMTPAEAEKSYNRDDLFVDVGLPAEQVRERVRIGDLITLRGETLPLLNDQAAGKTMDDRACIGMLLLAAERLQAVKHEADVYFVCSTQEEVGAYGAWVSAFDIDPDLAVAIDVTHAPIPGSRPNTTVPLDAPAITYGPYIQPKLLERLKDTAKRHHISYNLEPANRSTGTDMDEIGVARDGIPGVLIDLPLRYMHTSVEVIDLNALREGARLLALFAGELTEGWDEELWI